MIKNNSIMRAEISMQSEGDGPMPQTYRFLIRRILITLACLCGCIGILSCKTQGGPSVIGEDAHTSRYQVLSIPQNTNARSLYFEKLVLNLPPNEKFGELSAGLYCEKSRDLTWGTSSSVLTDDDVRVAFNQVLEQANYPVIGKAESLFEDFSKTELVVAGLVKNLRIEACSRFNMNILLMPLAKGDETNVTGKTRITVNWKVYDVREKRVVYETTTEGVFADSVKIADPRSLMLQAFARATEGLLSESDFFRLVTRATENGKPKI
jgi:hypothetical protein